MGKQAVTGAFGFSGKYLAARLLRDGHEVITLTNSPDRPNPFAGQVKAIPFRFDNPRVMADSLQGVDVLYNTYWVRFNASGHFSHREAVDNTRALFEAARMAGVRRVVHVSITNADAASPLEYFRGKGELEAALAATGLSHAIVRPAVLFGPEDILINNIAWTIRRFPVFALFGDGEYHIQPIHVEDMAALMQEQGKLEDNSLVNAVGPEDYSYRDLVEMIAAGLGIARPLVRVPPTLGYLASLLIGKVVGDVFVTRDEIRGLMADTLHVPGYPPTGKTRLSSWVRENRDKLGQHYAGEMPRRLNRTLAY